MSGHSLPKEYKGFLTAELLALWKSIPDRSLYDPPVLREKVSAMRDLLYEYSLLDFGDDEPAKIRRSKQLMAPYGIDPAPWADENGVSQEHLGKAFAERARQEEKARRARIQKQKAEHDAIEAAKPREQRMKELEERLREVIRIRSGKEPS